MTLVELFINWFKDDPAASLIHIGAVLLYLCFCAGMVAAVGLWVLFPLFAAGLIIIGVFYL